MSTKTNRQSNNPYLCALSLLVLMLILPFTAGSSAEPTSTSESHPAAGAKYREKAEIGPGSVSMTEAVATEILSSSLQHNKLIVTPAAQPGLDAASTEAATTIFTDGFEGAFPGPWNVVDADGAANGEVFWDDTNFRSDVGLESAGAADGGADRSPPGGDYADNMSSWMVYGPFDLSDANGGAFSFRYWLDTELDFDYLFYGVSVNGTNFNGIQLSGNSMGWQSRSIDFTNTPNLGDVTGDSSVWIAFVFRSDDSVTAEGAYVDQVSITKTTTASNVDLALTMVDAPPGTFAPGDVITIVNTTQNIGTDASSPYRLSFYASANNVITPSDFKLGHIDRGALTPGAKHVKNTNATLRSDLPDDLYYIGAILEVSDANLSNNTNHDPVPITVSSVVPSPDIRISPLTLEFSAAVAGEPTGEGLADLTDTDTSTDERDLKIYLRKGTVDPELEFDGALESRTEKSRFAPGHRIMQFDRIPTHEERARLEAEGISLLHYIPNNAYWVSVARPVSAMTTEQIAGRVLWVWDPDPEYKMAAAITDGFFPSHATNLDGSVEVQVLLFEDVEQDAVTAAMLAVDGVEIVAWNAAKLVTIRLPEHLIWDIAALDQVHWVEPKPAPDITNNATAASRIRVDALRSAPFSLRGAGVTVGVWDGGAVFPHADFGTRLTVQNAVTEEWHATHVAGTVGGSGAGDASAKGMAPVVKLHSYDWDDDEIEMRAAAVDLSNHSYGSRTGWSYDSGTDMWVDNGNSDNFGRYSSTAAEWDDIVFDTNLLVFKSAGNDRNDGPGCPTGPDCDGPFDSIPHKGNAKNVFTICATDDSDVMTSFSSWGPADDGRVKPDLCANGANLRSTDLGGGYRLSSGTSMSTPSASGAASLLFQHFKAKTGMEPAPHTLKALMVHGAKDLGRPGPDYEYGWGLINALVSASLISNGTFLVGSIADTGSVQSFNIVVPVGASELKVTLAWTDPAGSPTAGRALVNDLNLVLLAPDGTSRRLPWVLDVNLPGQNATRGTNLVDNVEQVLAKAPAAGVWTVKVKGGAVPQGPQEFALVAGGLENSGQFTIFNDGTGDLRVNTISLGTAAPWISWSPLAPFTIPPGGSQAVVVLIDFAIAPMGNSSRRLLVTSNDAGESPYPGGVFINVEKLAAVCYALSLKRTGTGLVPLASPASSAGCASGKYHAGELVSLTARPSSGWSVGSWSGTNNDGSTLINNQVTMPATAHTVTAHYVSSCVYTVVQPNGGELLIRGNTYSFIWSSAGGGCAATARLELYKRGVLKLIISSATADKIFDWKIPGVASGSDYRFKAIDTGNPKSNDSSDKNFTIKGPSEVLAAPADVQATDGTYEDRVEVTWTAVASATTYRIFRCDGPDTGCVTAGFKSGGTLFSDTGGDLETVYHYRVMACKPGLCSAFSDPDEGHRHRADVRGLDSYIGVALVDDINGNGSNDIAGLTTLDSGIPVVVIIDSRTRVTLKTKTYLSNKYEPIAIDSNGINVVVLARNRTNSQIVAQARDAKTGALLFTVTAVPFPAPGF